MTELPLPANTTWTVDAAHTLVSFSVRHMTIARVTGRFPVRSGTMHVPVAPGRPLAASASVDAAGVYSGHPRRDELIRSADFLDTAQYPVIEFSADSVTHIADDQWRLSGPLTIKGVTKPVAWNCVFGGVVSHRGATRAGISAAAEIDRRDFNLTWSADLDNGGLVVGHKVELTLEVELVRT